MTETSPASRGWRSRRAAGLAVACHLSLSVPASTAQPTLAEQGRHALETRCSRCHAIGPEGESPHAQAPPFREIVKRYPPEDLEESLAEGIMSGHPDMPEFVLTPEEIAAVVAYLHTLTGK